jgi:hypothetical protein
MSQDREEDKPTQPDRGLRKLTAPLVFGLALLAIPGGCCIFYSKKNSSYLSGRNFRLLATMGRQVSRAVKAEGRVLESLNGLPVQERESALDEKQRLRKTADELGLNLNDLRPGGDEHCVMHPGQSLFQRLEPAPDGYRLDLHFEGTKRALCAWVSLQQLLEPIFVSRRAFDPSREPFDAVLLVDSTGEVIYQHGPPEISVHHLDLLPTAARPPKPQGEDKTAGAAQDREPQALMGSSRELDREVAGRGFKVFVQPVTLPFRGDAEERTEATKDPHQLWFICGLVSKEKNLRESLAVSPNYLAAAVGALLLCLLSWPLLKFKLLGERQRVRVADMLIAALCSLLGVCLVTLLLLGLYHRHELERLADRQVETFASRMAANLDREVRSAYLQLAALEAAAAQITGPPEDPIVRENQLGAVKEGGPYPFWEDFALIDREGDQELKWSTSNTAFPPISVKGRAYFKRALSGDLWQLPARDGGTPGPPFAVESVVSWTNGERQAVLSKPADERLKQRSTVDYQVATLAVPMLSVIAPVVPFGFEFAVIDLDGKVLFHSDMQRNLWENLFEETDQDRRLRSAVFARHPATLDLRYGGEDFRARLEPVAGLPWTVVALRASGPIEEANLGSVLATIVFLLLYGGAFAVILAAVVLVRPGYRAGWLWPAPERANDYVRLAGVYLLLCAGSAMAVLLLPGGRRLFGVAWLLPPLAIVLGYLQLTRYKRWETRSLLAAVAGLLLLCILAGVMLASFEGGALLHVLVVLPVLAACFLVYVHPQRWRRLTRRGYAPISLSYPVVGLLLLLLTAVLPTMCIFKTAERIQTECLVKHGQLQLAAALEDRRIRAAQIYSDEQGKGRAQLRTHDLVVGTEKLDREIQDDPRRPSRTSRTLDFYGQSFFDTRLAAPPRPEAAGAPEAWPELMAELLPAYSVYSAETRELLSDRASDGDRFWSRDRQGGRLVLAGSSLGYELVSRLPPSELSIAGLLAGAGGGTSALAALAGVAMALAAAILVLLLLSGLTYFIARHLFLVDLFEPLWSGREGELPATVGSNVFLLSRQGEWRIRDDDQSFFRLNFKHLEDEPTGWSSRLLGVLRSPVRTVLLAGFEHRIFDAAFNEKKLALLEDLVKHRTVVILSTVSPSLLFARQDAAAGAPAGPPDSEERWWALLSSFTLIDDDLRLRRQEQDLANVTVVSLRRLRRLLRRGRRPPTAAAGERFGSRLLDRECGTDPFLRRIGGELDQFAPGLDRRQLLEEFGERAESYYRALWTSCSRDEQVVLGHLGEDGLVNEKNRRLVRRLMVRGLIRRQPNFRLMNETFKLFVLQPACRSQVVALEHAAGASAWDRFRRPFFGVLVAAAVFFVATQRQLLDESMAVVTAFTAGLPVLVKVADFLGGRRSGAAAK